MERKFNLINRFSRGWTASFASADTPSAFEEFDEWLPDSVVLRLVALMRVQVFSVEGNAGDCEGWVPSIIAHL